MKGDPVSLKKLIPNLAAGSALCLCLVVFSAQVHAQVDGTGGATTGGDVGTDTTGNTTNAPDASIGEGRGGVGDIGGSIDIETTPDQRNQGFIGQTAEGIQSLGFIGRPGEISGPGLSDDATLGGGVNDSIQNNFNIGSNNAGAQNGFSVTRRNVRARIRPRFYAPQRSPNQVVSQFQNRFISQPGSTIAPESYTIRVENKTAFLSGAVRNQAESQRLVRQLRLEPGVYKIDNQLQVAQ
ncbi:MAG: hypothetical protein ACI87E_002650 [Mariniblastus sp.]